MAANVACATPVRRLLPNTVTFRTPRAAHRMPGRSRPGFLSVLLRALSAAAV